MDYLSLELGINFNHISAKSLTVLNPLRPVDARIMDDADLAGPIIFCFCFALFLLLVSHLNSRASKHPLLSTVLCSVYLVWEAAIRIHLWSRTIGICVHVPFAEHDVGIWD